MPPTTIEKREGCGPLELSLWFFDSLPPSRKVGWGIQMAHLTQSRSSHEKNNPNPFFKKKKFGLYQYGGA